MFTFRLFTFHTIRSKFLPASVRCFTRCPYSHRTKLNSIIIFHSAWFQKLRSISSYHHFFSGLPLITTERLRWSSVTWLKLCPYHVAISLMSLSHLPFDHGWWQGSPLFKNTSLLWLVLPHLCCPRQVKNQWIFLQLYRLLVTTVLHPLWCTSLPSCLRIMREGWLPDDRMRLSEAHFYRHII